MKSKKLFIFLFILAVVGVGSVCADTILYNNSGWKVVGMSDGSVYIYDNNNGTCSSLELLSVRKSSYDTAFDWACDGERMKQINSSAGLANAIAAALYPPAAVVGSIATAVYNFWCTFG